MPRHAVPIVLGFVLSLTATACASGERHEGSSGAEADLATGTRPAVIAGEASDDSQNAVVLLYAFDATGQTGPPGGCTGTLLAPNVLLTARHCVSQTSEGSFACANDGSILEGTGGKAEQDYRPNQLYVFTGTTRPVFGRGRPPIAAQGKEVFHTDVSVLCGNDIAVVVLDRALDLPIAPIRLDGRPAPGDELTVVGWGLTEDGSSPDTRQQRTGITVTRVGPGDQTVRAGALPANDFEVGEAICQGDSGGPALDSHTGAVVGVVSRGGGGEGGQGAAEGCVGSHARNVYTSIEPFKGMLLQAFEAAGAQPWIEGQRDPRLPPAEDAGADAAPAKASDGASTTGGCALRGNEDRGQPWGAEGVVALAGVALLATAVRRGREPRRPGRSRR